MNNVGDTKCHLVWPLYFVKNWYCRLNCYFVCNYVPCTTKTLYSKKHSNMHWTNLNQLFCIRIVFMKNDTFNKWTGLKYIVVDSLRLCLDLIGTSVLRDLITSWQQGKCPECVSCVCVGVFVLEREESGECEWKKECVAMKKRVARLQKF